MSAADIRPLRERIAEFEAQQIVDAVVRHNGNVCEAARELLVHRNKIHRILTRISPNLSRVRLRRVQSLLKFTAQRLQQK